MKLIQLSSSNPDFRSINFNDGLNIVLGQKASANKKETFNGVGKTLSLGLIHYMLGGSISSCVKDILKDHELILTFKHLNHNYQIIRKNDDIYVNEEKCESHKKYLEFLNSLFLSTYQLEQKLTFRGLLTRFSRNGEEAYIDTLSQSTTKENGFIKNTYNSHLLGLNIEYIAKKDTLTTEKTNLKEIQKQLQALNIVEGNELLDVEEEIETIEKVLSNFQIAKNYTELRSKADLLTNEINDKRNHLFRNKKAIENKKKSLEETPSIDIEVIQKLYSEADFFFNESINKRLEDVEKFHIALIKNRQIAFIQEIKSIELANKIITQEIDLYDKQRSELLSILENKGAFEEYISLSKHLEILKSKKSDLLKYQELEKEFKQKELDAKLKIDILNKEVYEYFLKNQTIIEKIKKEFRNITKDFYENHTGNIDIGINTDLKAHKVYDITPKIYADGSKGINEVKIFSYDLLLLRLNPKLFSFLAHDSILFDNIDPRQTSRAFELILDEIQNNDLQYFTTINKNILDDFLKETTNNELRQKIEESIVLSLSEKEKLFGQNFDC